MTIRVLAVLVVLTACGGGNPPPKSTMTQRQRDSAIGASRLPGAKGVQRALRAQDSAAARNARLDSIRD